MEKTKPIALVDLSYLFRRTWHNQAPDAEINSAAAFVLKEVSGLRSGGAHVILCVDSPPYFRSTISEAYKANREKPSDGIISQMKWLKDRLTRDGYPVARAKSFEADDVAASLASQLEEAGFQDIRLVGPDKDMCQCVTERVRQYVPGVGGKEGQILGPHEVTLRYGVPPAAMVDLQALMGDSSDNIPGCPGIGPKRAAQLLNEHDLSLDSLITQLEARAADDDLQSKVEKAVVEHKDQILLSRQLVELNAALNLDLDSLLTQREPEPLVEVEPEAALPGYEPEAEPESKPEAKPEHEAKPEAPPEAYSTKLAKSPPVTDFALSLQPQSASDAFALSGYLHNSRLYQKFPSREAIFAVILRGRELGLGSGTALDSFHLIQGRPTASAHLIMALAQRDPDCEYLMLVESSATSATYETKHRRQPRPVRITYTLDEAEAAGLTRKGGPWKTATAAMLRKTAGVLCVRAVFQGAVCGLLSAEEIEQ